ncbi:MAG TPA: EAL domain-containing protein [Rhodocyclaceae bacterium]|nr:EAL domain-containing protein [Rhodocyclaceae bacterium]
MMLPLFQRLRTRLLLLVLVSVLPALGIIVHTVIEQQDRAISVAEQQAMELARGIAERRQELTRTFLDFAGLAHADGGIDSSAPILADLMRNTALPQGSIATLVDARGTIVARFPDTEHWVGRPVPDLQFFRSLVDNGERSTVESIWLDGVRRVTYLTPLEGSGGLYIRIGIPKDAVVGDLDNILWHNLALFAAALLAVLGVGWMASDHLVLRRVRDLAETARRFGAGDLAARPRIAPDGGELGELARAFEDMADDLKRRQQHIEHLATRDVLTGLPNRHLLLDRIGQAIAYTARSGHCFAVAIVNIDRLKTINGSLGHARGDALLVAAAQRLRAAVREEDTVARLEGDEFVLLFTGLKSTECAVAAAHKATDVFRWPFQIDGQELHLTASTGIALYPGDGESADLLIKNAESAMHRVKAEGGNGLQFYMPQMSADAADRLCLEQALRRALEHGEFELHYQPKVDLRTGRIGSAEALIRWRHPDWGMVAPARFIPLAEDTGLVVPLGEWVLRTACRQIRAWQEAGLPPLSVAVNLSPRQFTQGDITELVADILAETGVEPGWLELEVTESTIMRDLEHTVSALSRLRSLGAAVSIDDFGTGYSSLGYLRRLPLDKLKIDRSFVCDLTQNVSAALLTQQIIAIAHALNLTVIAEGVETASELQFLVQHGCDQVQGYYFSRPLPAAEFGALVERSPVWPEARIVPGPTPAALP